MTGETSAAFSTRLSRIVTDFTQYYLSFVPGLRAAALSVLSRIDSALLASVRRKAEYMREQFTGAPGITGVTGLGLLMGLSTVRPAPEIVGELIDDGVLCLTAKDKVRLMPALNIPGDTLETAVKKIKAACAKI